MHLVDFMGIVRIVRTISIITYLNVFDDIMIILMLHYHLHYRDRYCVVVGFFVFILYYMRNIIMTFELFYTFTLFQAVAIWTFSYTYTYELLKNNE